MTAPDVSVIVLGWNGRQYVDACLDSLRDQDFARPYEVLFVDNGSRDGTADAADCHAGVQVHRLDRNHGYCAGNNIAFAFTVAPLVVFLNQDVIVHRAWLSRLVAAVESNPSIKAAHACLVHPWNPEFAAADRHGALTRAYVPDLSPLGFVAYRELPSSPTPVDTIFLSGSSLILARDAIDEIGGYVFDPDMWAYGEDLDLALRLRSAGYRTVAATDAVVYHFHTLSDSLTVASLRKTVRIISNRLLAAWKASTWLEFAFLALLTVVGSPFNAGEFGLSRARKLAYGLLLVPPTLLALVTAIAWMPRFAGRRRQELALRRAPRWWLPRAMVFDRARLAGDDFRRAR